MNCEKNIKFYLIGEVAEKLKMSAKTLRHYEQLELIVPHHVSSENNYRYYSYEQFFQIDVIRFLNKTMNIPLKEIKKVLDPKDGYEQVLEVLNNHQKELENKIASLEYSKQLTRNMIADIMSDRKISRKEDIFEQYLLTRTLHYIDVNAPLEQIDLYANRTIIDSINVSSKENNLMCLVIKVPENHNFSELIVEGFGLYAEVRNPKLKNMNLREGRYAINRFIYSESNTKKAMRDLIDYSNLHNYRLPKRAYLVSKMVDLSVSSKYEYCMDLQLLTGM